MTVGELRKAIQDVDDATPVRYFDPIGGPHAIERQVVGGHVRIGTVVLIGNDADILKAMDNPLVFALGAGAIVSDEATVDIPLQSR